MFKGSACHSHFDDDSFEAVRYSVTAGRNRNYVFTALNSVAAIMKGYVRSGDGNVIINSPSFGIYAFRTGVVHPNIVATNKVENRLEKVPVPLLVDSQKTCLRDY